jgi:UDP-N-acetylglucosamine:LPS N-acetylglucosamine transferase
MLKEELQTTINESELVLSRSGFSTIMDLEKLKAKAFFIPTPGQYEQEYLSKYLEQKRIAPYADQDNFNLEMLDTIKLYTGFGKNKETSKVDFKTLFDLYFS